MTAAAGPRGDPDGCLRGPPLSPPILSPALANVDGNGVVTKAGYCFRIFLPGKDGWEVRERAAPSWQWKGAPPGGG